MRTLATLVVAFLIPFVVITLLLPLPGFNVKSWVTPAVATIAGIYASAIVVMGESLIEDLVKAIIMLLLTGLLWLMSAGTAFLFIAACIASATGIGINQANRFLAEQLRRKSVDS